MGSWFLNNLGNIAVCIVLTVVVGMIIRTLIRNKKKGKSSCGCGCATCAMSGSCRKG